MAQILIVDDEEIIREILKAVLETNGHEVLEATDGDTCIDMARASTPDLIILDMNMPKMTGFEVAPLLKTHPRTKKTPILALTADKTTESIEAAYEAGCDHYLAKPILGEKLVQVVSDMLAM